MSAVLLVENSRTDPYRWLWLPWKWKDQHQHPFIAPTAQRTTVTVPQACTKPIFFQVTSEYMAAFTDPCVCILPLTLYCFFFYSYTINALRPTHICTRTSAPSNAHSDVQLEHLLPQPDMIRFPNRKQSRR